MKKIIDTHLATNTNGEKFFNNVNDAIGTLQDKGLEVDVKYQITMRGYEVVHSALLIGYEEV